MEALTDTNGHVHHHQSPPIAYKTKFLRPIFHLKNIIKMKIKALLSITATAEVSQKNVSEHSDTSFLWFDFSLWLI